MSQRWLAILVLFGLSITGVSATVLVPAEFKEIVADAGLIVRGRVTDVRAVLGPDRSVESIATLAVDATLKGSPAEFVSLTVPGGTIGRYTTRMIGAPVLRVGQQAVFFLKRDPRNGWRPIGLSMGVAQISADAATGSPVMAAPVVLGQTTDAGRVVRGDARRQMIPVGAYESLVRLVMAGQAPPAASDVR